MDFGKKILDYKEDILNDLKTLLEIKSVSSEGSENCKKALDFILKRAEESGLTVKNIKDKAGHIELGSGGELRGVLTHLDVVPAGKNWSVEPFTLTRKNGRLYGRGIVDDKGASIIDLYCLKALKDNHVKGKNTVRCIFGTDEEIGMSDMETYFSEEPLPEMSFTPDSDYGICFAEKGILQIKISGGKNNSIIEFYAGSAVNAVPEEARAVYYSNNELKEDSFLGKAAHACMPDKGKNAAAGLIMLLKNNEVELSSLLTFINDKISNETNGESLGIKMSDEPSGELTCNLGKVRINEAESYFTLDIRYPVTKDGNKIYKLIKLLCESYNLKTEIIHNIEPLYLPKDSKIVSTLSKAYEDITGEKPELYSTGGGTYARMLKGKGVAFGPAFKEDNVNMHNADESIDEEMFFTHAKICLQAIYKLYTE